MAVDDLADTLADFKQKLASIELGEDGITALRKIEQEKRMAYLEAANALHCSRVKAAAELDRLIMRELPPLKMEKARFETKIEKQSEASWTEQGFDDVYFTVATNPNSPQGPLNKIASGGELSRFMLALKVNLAASSNVCTMIFDEVDAGIGGATAQAVGERLARLGNQVQVLVVTHSPQVAAVVLRILRLKNILTEMLPPPPYVSWKPKNAGRKLPVCLREKPLVTKRAPRLRFC